MAVLCFANVAGQPALSAEPVDFELGSFYLVWLGADGEPADWVTPSYEISRATATE
jgi:hypothetical protein